MAAREKKQTLLAYLSRGVAMVHLDARRPGVVVPPQHAEDAHLRLNLSYRYSIPDLEISDAHVQATLSFGGRYFQCVLPWEAIFGITSNASGDGQVWPEDLPVEVTQARAAAERGTTAAERGRPSLVAVPEASAPREPPDPGPDGTQRRHLRLVR